MSPLHGFNTRAIHAGQDPDPATGDVVVPLHLATTFKQDGVGGLRGGYEYARSANPTRTALQEALAALEQGRTGLAFASGLAAEDTLLRTVCEPGSHVVLGGDAYGGTFRLISKVASRWGVEHTPADLNDLDALGISYKEVVEQLETEGLDKFVTSWSELLETVQTALNTEGK